MPKRITTKHELKQCCFRYNPELTEERVANACPSHEGACRFGKVALDRMIAGRGSSSNEASTFETFADARKRKRDDKQTQIKDANAAHRSTLARKECSRWLLGECRYLLFAGNSRCLRGAHPDEADRTPKILCCSAAARPKPKKCFFTPEACQYEGHREM